MVVNRLLAEVFKPFPAESRSSGGQRKTTAGSFDCLWRKRAKLREGSASSFRFKGLVAFVYPYALAPSPILKGNPAIMRNFRYIKKSAVPGCGRICSHNPLDLSLGRFSCVKSQSGCVPVNWNAFRTENFVRKGSYGILKSPSPRTPIARPLSSTG